jgi:hypothetical protein
MEWVHNVLTSEYNFLTARINRMYVSAREPESSVASGVILMSQAPCEVIRLDYVILLMDTVVVSCQVRMIAYRMYRTPVQYSKHYLYS